MSGNERLTVIILAAGKGTRMKSPLPKVLHPVAGRPMLEKVVLAAKGAGAVDVRLVIGHGGHLVKSVIEPWGVTCYEQKEQKGTAHAVISAKPETIEGDVVIMNGDHPLIEASDILAFVKEFRQRKLDVAVVTSVLKNPAEFGRIIRHMGVMKAIVEAKDASADTLKIREVSTGIYVVKAKVLAETLPEIKNENSKGEYYLPDLISICQESRDKVDALVASPKVAVGVNTQAELARATKILYKRKVKKVMEEGALVLDPDATYIEDSVTIGQGTVVYPGCFLRGRTKIGSFCVLEPNVFISECEIADSVQIRAGSYLEHTIIQSKASVGPYARLRPETVIYEEAHVGNFVEMKKVHFGKGSKAGHLTYLGDAEIGAGVNIGCGTITCNYAADKKKYKTKIGDRVFVGSDTQFVAPITVGDDAVIGSGSTITKDVPAGALAVARGKQIVKENYVAAKAAVPRPEVTVNTKTSIEE